jgi:cell division protein FtsQ
MPPSLALPRRAVAARRAHPSSIRLRRPSPRLVVALLGLVVVLGGGWLWLRDSRLVAVRDVSIEGLYGAQAGQIEGALRDAARDMTTLHVRTDVLRTAVEPYPIVKSVEARPDFPHGLRIVVREHVAVGALAAAGIKTPVAADGTVLRDTPADGLPVISVDGWAPGARLEGRAAQAVAVLAAAPAPLRARIRQISLGAKGWTVPLTDGPVLYLGDAHRVAAKWIAAVRVLEDPGAAGATYIDLRLPDRPAAGGVLAPPAPEATDAATPGATTTGASSSSPTTTAPTTTSPSTTATTPSTTATAPATTPTP